MTLPAALAAYLVAAGLLTITPGLDTALVLRAAAGGRVAGALAGLGVVCGLVVWGLAAAFGVGALLSASQWAYAALRLAGALYLGWLGLRMILKPRPDVAVQSAPGQDSGWWARGLVTNLLNPKVGVFYVSFLPQFVPAGAPAAPFMILLALVHALMGVVWFALLITVAAPFGRWLRAPDTVRWLDRLTGVVFLGFGARLALERR